MTFVEALQMPIEDIPTERLFEAVTIIGARKLDIRRGSPGFLLDSEFRPFFSTCNHRIALLLDEEDARDRDRREKAKQERNRR